MAAIIAGIGNFVLIRYFTKLFEVNKSINNDSVELSVISQAATTFI